MSKKILILNGSPRSKGNTAMLCDTLSAGARSAGHQVTRFDLHKLDIHGCLGCVKGGKDPASPCVQKDDWGSSTPPTGKPISSCWHRPCITGAFPAS